MKALFFLPFVAICASSLFGCDEGVIPSVPQDSGTDANDVLDSSVTVIRTVETRNPFGDTTISSNLLVDGDFELTGRTGQMPWMALSQTGQATLTYATGGQCRSGVRCASITDGTQLVGFFASPKTGNLSASLWVRPDSGNCGDVFVGVVDLNDQSGSFTAELKPGDKDATGWCSFTAKIPNMADKQPVIYVSPNTGIQGAVRVDDGVVLPVLGTEAFVHSDRKMSSTERTRIRFISDWIRKHRRFDAPPTQAHPTP